MLSTFFDDPLHVDRDRRLLGRPFPLLTAIAIFILWAVLKKRWWLAGGLMIVAVLLSHLFVFPLAVAGLVSFWNAINRRWRDSAYGAISCMTGTVVGFL